MIKQIEKIGFVNITEIFCANKSANFKAIFTKYNEIQYSTTLFRDNSYNGLFIEHVMAIL
jgi:hypothetical protein